MKTGFSFSFDTEAMGLAGLFRIKDKVVSSINVEPKDEWPESIKFPPEDWNLDSGTAYCVIRGCNEIGINLKQHGEKKPLPEQFTSSISDGVPFRYSPYEIGALEVLCTTRDLLGPGKKGRDTRRGEGDTEGDKRGRDQEDGGRQKGPSYHEGHVNGIPE